MLILEYHPIKHRECEKIPADLLFPTGILRHAGTPVRPFWHHNLKPGAFAGSAIQQKVEEGRRHRQPICIHRSYARFSMFK